MSAESGGLDDERSLEELDSCRQFNCPDRPQQLVELQLAGGDVEVLALCMIHTCDLRRRDPDNITVIGP